MNYWNALTLLLLILLLPNIILARTEVVEINYENDTLRVESRTEEFEFDLNITKSFTKELKFEIGCTNDTAVDELKELCGDIKRLDKKVDDILTGNLKAADIENSFKTCTEDNKEMEGTLTDCETERDGYKTTRDDYNNRINILTSEKKTLSDDLDSKEGYVHWGWAVATLLLGFFGFKVYGDFKGGRKTPESSMGRETGLAHRPPPSTPPNSRGPIFE
jgi:hypothetical protein